MNGFISLHERKTNTTIFINPEYIVSIKDMRSGNSNFEWTVLTTTRNTYDVNETGKEICNLISELNNN
jgi:hypothetical protein